jgi:hypothetical protein
MTNICPQHVVVCAIEWGSELKQMDVMMSLRCAPCFCEKPISGNATPFFKEFERL